MERERDAGEDWREERAEESAAVTGHLLGAPQTARQTRVSQLRALVGSGRYEVDYGAVAEALLQRPVIQALLRSN